MRGTATAAWAHDEPHSPHSPLQLKKRQDLLSLVLQLAYPERDMLVRCVVACHAAAARCVDSRLPRPVDGGAPAARGPGQQREPDGFRFGRVSPQGSPEHAHEQHGLGAHPLAPRAQPREAPHVVRPMQFDFASLIPRESLPAVPSWLVRVHAGAAGARICSCPLRASL